uniref:Uncharacterized protein n=1 Tax=Anopheles farauti TaxID=69004 RepID=A0A182Q7N5_9DIPT
MQRPVFSASRSTRGCVSACGCLPQVVTPASGANGVGRLATGHFCSITGFVEMLAVVVVVVAKIDLHGWKGSVRTKHATTRHGIMNSGLMDGKIVLSARIPSSRERIICVRTLTMKSVVFCSAAAAGETDVVGRTYDD